MDTIIPTPPVSPPLAAAPVLEFVEAGPHEKGFAAHFKTKIAPLLEGVEANRLVQYASYKKRLALSIPLGLLFVAGGIILTANMHDEDAVFVKIGIGLAVALSIWVSAPVRRYKQDVKSKFMPVVCEFFGNMTYGLTGTSMVETMYRDEIFPSYTSAQMEDFIEGTYQSVKVKIHESTLKRKNGKNTVTVFRGFVLELEFPKEFHGKTTMLKDGGTMGNFFTGKDFKGLARVELEDPEFEKMFQVFSSDQVEARFVLTTAFMERLLNLAKLRSPNGTPKVQCVFEHKTLVISVPCTQDLFEPGSISKSALQVEDLHAFLEQMKQVFELVDVLKLTRV